jgi:hypothetical protein
VIFCPDSFTSARCAGRRRGSEATECEGASARFWAERLAQWRCRFLAVRFIPAERPLIPPSPRTRGEGGREVRGNDCSRRHCERQRSNPGRLARKLECFVAIAPRNDEICPPPRSETERGSGITRSVVEGVCRSRTLDGWRTHQRRRPFHRPPGGSPSPFRGAG